MRVALYARVSTLNGQHPEMQLSELREYGARRDWQVVSEYVDQGVSGARERRPQLDRLMADAHRRKFDRFVVPKDFDEFHERFPHYVPNWVKKHSDRFAQPEDMEDWTQDLLVHLKCLPPTSKYREAGKEDIVQTFDPARHYGASQRRFQNYINLCLANKFNTMYAARMKNPLCRTGNLSLSGHVDGEDWGAVNDEYCHTHSEHLRNAAERLEKQWQDRQRIVEFAHFVRREDSAVEPAIGAIFSTGSHCDVAKFLGITHAGFTRMRTRLSQLGGCFENGETVPRQRKPHTKRRKSVTIGSLAAAA